MPSNCFIYFIVSYLFNSLFLYIVRIALRTSHENTQNKSAISNSVIHIGAVGIVTAPVSLIVMIPLFIPYCIAFDITFFTLFISLRIEESSTRA